MIVVRDDLSEDAGGYECCAEMYRETLYPASHRQFWEIVGRCEAGSQTASRLVRPPRQGEVDNVGPREQPGEDRPKD